MFSDIDLLGLRQEIMNMPEFHARQKLRGLELSLYTFDHNYGELRNLIVLLSNDPSTEPLMYQRNRDQLHAVLREILRLLHNFVAATMSLVEHTRNLYKEMYRPRGLFRDYQDRVKRDFAHDPLCQFVQDLRNFLLHYRVPQISFSVHIEHADANKLQEHRLVCLLKDDLRGWNGWTALAKKYLHDTVEEISLLDVIEGYRSRVIQFYQWFLARHLEIDAQDIERLEEKERVLFLAWLVEDIKFWYAQRDQGLPADKNEVFIQIFRSNEFAELDKTPPDSDARASRAIELLQEHFDVPEEIRDMIVRLYREPVVSEPLRQEPRDACSHSEPEPQQDSRTTGPETKS